MMPNVVRVVRVIIRNKLYTLFYIIPVSRLGGSASCSAISTTSGICNYLVTLPGMVYQYPDGISQIWNIGPTPNSIRNA